MPNQDQQHPPPIENPGASAGPLVYDCPNVHCDEKAILQNQIWCNKCDTALVWSGHPTDQPRVHPGDEAGPPVGTLAPHPAPVQLGPRDDDLVEDAQAGVHEASKGDPRRDAIVTGIDGFPPRVEAEKLYEAPVGPGTPNAPPPGDQAAPAGFSDDVDPGSRPGAKNPASEASGVQEAKAPKVASPETEAIAKEIAAEAEAPASALATPASLPGESKPSVDEVKPEAVGPLTLPDPPKGEAKQPPPMAASGRALEGATVPSLPDDPDPRAPLSGLRCSEIAAVAHTANVAYRQQVGDDGGPSWMQADDAIRESCIAGVKAVLSGQINGPHVSHRAWYERKLAEGWEYGEVKSVAAKTHPNMAAKGVWGDLPEVERRKDLLFLAIAVALIRAP